MEELREAVAGELAHRMRNLLSVVNSLVSLSAASAVNVEEFRKSLTGRLAALARTQSALITKQQSTNLRELFLTELAQYQTPNGANVAINVPPVSLGPRAAQILALTVHELATNSAKYGALGSPNGRVTVTSALKGDGDQGQLVIKWREAGGPPVRPPERQGFGTTLITQLVAKSLRAEVAMEYPPEGLICRMILSMAAVEAAGGESGSQSCGRCSRTLSGRGGRACRSSRASRSSDIR